MKQYLLLQTSRELRTFLAFAFCLLFNINIQGQTYNMSNTSVNTCSGTFYDSGGASGTYQNSENYTMTFCSSVPGNRISFNFSAFDTENSFEHLIIYDGPNTSSPQIGNYTGSTSPGVVTSSGSCLTFVFTSDGSITYTGWLATISCLPPPVGYNMGNLGTISTCSGYFYDSGAASGNYSNNENYTVTFCSSVSGQQIKFTFSSFATEAGLDVLTVYNGPNTGSPLLGTFSGNALPPIISSTNGCLTFVFTSNGSNTLAGWMATISCTTPTPPTFCSGANPFCTGTNYLFPATTNFPSLGQVGCLYTTPNPAFYWMQVSTPGNIDIHIASGGDVDFICWGPFTSLAAACATNLMANAGVDCSYSIAAQEDCNIPNAQVGEVYVLLITNYANMVTNITFSQTSGSGATNCGIIAPPITNNGPLCVGQTLQLTVTSPTAGALYSWTGPNGFTSNAINPVIPNVTNANAGVYSMTITVGSQTSPPVTTTVVINPNPVVSPIAIPAAICLGSSTSLSATSNVTGTSFNWMPGSLSGSTVTVTPGSSTVYTVTGTASGCSGTNTVSVTVNPNPIVTSSATPSAICVGATSSLSATSTVPGTVYSWMPGSLIGSPVTCSPISTTTYTITGTAAGCTGTNTVIVTVNPVPAVTAVASPAAICNGASTSLSATSTVPGSMFSWMPGSLPGSPVTAIPNSTTTYTVTATAAGCTGSNSVVVTVNPNPVISPSATPSTICAGSSSSLDATSTVPGTIYTWNPGPLAGSPVSVTPGFTTTYTVTGSALGCTGSNTINVTVNPNPVINSVASPSTICEGNASSLTAVSTVLGTTYLWVPGNLAGSTVSVSPISTTTYSVTGTANGCTGSNTVIVTVNPNPVLSITATPAIICTGTSSSLSASSSVTGTSFVWIPGSLSGSPVTVSPNSNTTYTVTGTAAGCTGSSTLTVTVNPNPVVSPTATPAAICVGASSTLSANSTVSGTSYSWLPGNLSGSTVSVSPVTSTTYTVIGTASGCTGSSVVNVTVNANPVISLTATPSVICAGTSSNLNASSTVTGTTYIWQPGNLNGSSVSVTPASSTIYSVTGTSNGCTGSNSVSVSVNPLPVISALATPSSICTSATSSLTASSSVPGTTYTWSPGGLTGTPISVSPGSTTVYTVTGTASGCSGNTTVTLTVNNNITLTSAASPSSICIGGVSNLSCSGADNYLWTPGGLTVNTINVSPNSTTVYTINGTSVAGCTGSTTVTVTVNPNPVISATASPSSVCQGQSSVLSGSGASNYNWLPLGLSGSSVTVTPIANTTYSVTGTDLNGCSGTTTVTVNYIGVPQIEIIPSPQEGCSPLSVNFTYSTVAPILDSSWQWNFGDLGAIGNTSNEQGPTHVYNNGGIYIVQFNAQMNSGCQVSSIDTVFVSSKPVADFYFTPDFAYTNYPSIYFKDQSVGATIWNWDFGDPIDPTLNISHLVNPVHIFSDSGSFHVQLIVENNGCRDTADKYINIYLDALVFVPNAFTPNGDGINDVFIPMISGIEEGSYSLLVFDRWGKEIFSTMNYAEGWDGRRNEKDVALGVYTYIISYKEIMGVTHKLKGIVALIR